MQIEKQFTRKHFDQYSLQWNALNVVFFLKRS